MRPQLRARFFVASTGVVVERDRPLTPAQRRAIFDRDGWQCVYCGVRVTWLRSQSRALLADTRPGAVDHVFALARGGRSEPSNLVLACEPCNASKGAA